MSGLKKIAEQLGAAVEWNHDLAKQIDANFADVMRLYAMVRDQGLANYGLQCDTRDRLTGVVSRLAAVEKLKDRLSALERGIVHPDSAARAVEKRLEGEIELKEMSCAVCGNPTTVAYKGTPPVRVVCLRCDPKANDFALDQLAAHDAAIREEERKRAAGMVRKRWQYCGIDYSVNKVCSDILDHPVDADKKVEGEKPILSPSGTIPAKVYFGKGEKEIRAELDKIIGGIVPPLYTQSQLDEAVAAALAKDRERCKGWVSKLYWNLKINCYLKDGLRTGDVQEAILSGKEVEG